MKTASALLTASLFVGLPLCAADNPKTTRSPQANPATKPAGAKATDADAAWTALEPLLPGPKERPQTREEAIEIYKKHLTELDDKAAAFLKAHPSDPRRWKLQIQQVKNNSMRQFVKMEPLSDEVVAKTLADILQAPDADLETKGAASFAQVMAATAHIEEFQKLAAAHQKNFPDFNGNAQIDSQLKTLQVEKEIKEKPLELSFKATNGTAVDLAAMRGKVVLVDFWATWCGPCIGEIPNVVASYKKLHDKGFEIIGISFDQDQDKLDAMTKEKDMAWPQFFDGQGWKNKFGQQFGINSIPRMWLVNKKGMVVDTNGRQDLESKVAKLLAE